MSKNNSYNHLQKTLMDIWKRWGCPTKCAHWTKSLMAVQSSHFVGLPARQNNFIIWIFNDLIFEKRTRINYTNIVVIIITTGTICATSSEAISLAVGRFTRKKNYLMPIQRNRRRQRLFSGDITKHEHGRFLANGEKTKPKKNHLRLAWIRLFVRLVRSICYSTTIQ